QLLRGQRVGEAAQRVGTGGEATFGEDLVDDRLERRDRQQLRRKAVAEAETVAMAIHRAIAAAAAEQAAGIEDPDVGNLLDRLDRFGQRIRNDVDARQIEIVLDHLLAQR